MFGFGFFVGHVPQTDPSPVYHSLRSGTMSPKGEKLCAPQINRRLAKPSSHQPRIEADSVPSPCEASPKGAPKGEGQTDTLINRPNQGEVSYGASVGEIGGLEEQIASFAMSGNLKFQ